MSGQQREAHQQTEQIGQQHPLVRQVQAKAGHAGAGLEAGKQDLVGGDGGQTGESHLQYMVVEQRHPEQRGGKEDEVDGNARDGWPLRAWRGERQRCGEQGQQARQKMQPAFFKQRFHRILQKASRAGF